MTWQSLVWVSLFWHALGVFAFIDGERGAADQAWMVGWVTLLTASVCRAIREGRKEKP